MDYYLKVKELCETEGISISNLESELEIGNGTIGRWKKIKKDGSFPSPAIPTLKKIADFFNVPITYFIGGE